MYNHVKPFYNSFFSKNSTESNLLNFVHIKFQMLRNLQSVLPVLGRQIRQYSVKSDHAVWSLGRLNHVAIAVGLITISLFHLIQLNLVNLV